MELGLRGSSTAFPPSGSQTRVAFTLCDKRACVPHVTAPQLRMAMEQALNFLSAISRLFSLCYWPPHMQFLLISAGFELSYNFFFGLGSDL